MLNDSKVDTGHVSQKNRWLAEALRIEWLGQTFACLFWIGSVLVTGVNTLGDWLQIFAASCWLIANIATLVHASKNT